MISYLCVIGSALRPSMSMPSPQLQGQSTIPTPLPSASIAFILTLISIPKCSTTFQCIIYPIWTHFSTLLSNTFMFALSIPRACAPVQIIGIPLIFQTMITRVVQNVHHVDCEIITQLLFSKTPRSNSLYFYELPLSCVLSLRARGLCVMCYSSHQF